jgi:hypothetical protein
LAKKDDGEKPSKVMFRPVAIGVRNLTPAEIAARDGNKNLAALEQKAGAKPRNGLRKKKIVRKA